MSNPPPNPVAPSREELEGKEGAVIIPLHSGEPVEDGLGQENPGIIMFDHQLGFPIARNVASISSSERPAIAFTAPSCAATILSIV